MTADSVCQAPTMASQEEADALIKSKQFDYSAPPPFTVADLRNAIPKHCWVKSPWRSLSFFFRDMLIVFTLGAVSLYFDSWTLWPVYWFAQGTMFWALFVVGHDCGHGSFSDSRSLNDFIGHLSHAFILVPYHGWRISHRTHHANHGHVENDESWYPITKDIYEQMDMGSKLARFKFPFPLVAFPFYLWLRTPGKKGSHFDPKCDLFTESEYNDVVTSATWWWGMIALLAAFSVAFGPLLMFKLYFMPYWINVMWLDLVTYLHHHGYEKKVPWYRGKEWSYLRGGLSTIDRDYGIFNKIHHDIGTHVVHHLFPQIPHYHLTEATAAIKPILGNYYREPEACKGPFPFHLLEPLVKSFGEDHFVSSEGDIVFYQKSHEL